MEDKAQSDLENANERSPGHADRVPGICSRVWPGQAALQAAETSSQSALDANQLGYQVGVRINIDVLNAQSQLYDTKAKLAKARYDVVLVVG